MIATMIATLVFAFAAMTVMLVLAGLVASDGRRIAALLGAAIVPGQTAPAAARCRRTRA